MLNYIRNKFMNKKRVITTIAGVLLFLSIVLTFVWFNSTKNINQPAELALADIVSKVNQREIKEIKFKQTQVELTDVKGVKYYANLSNDATRESLLGTIKEYNQTNTSAPIKYDEEPVSSGFGWIVLINAAPFFIMWALTLAVIVYAVKTLSRNKS